MNSRCCRMSIIWSGRWRLSPKSQKGTISGLMAHHVSVLLLADIAKIGGSDADAVNKFVANGGVLVRFAGPRMTDGADALVPVPLRVGGRYLGSAMAWDKPQQLAPFPAASPFNGLAIPDEVTVSRQILAEPSAETSDRSWARLADGTPLVTARQQGQGWIVLFHVTASPAWSSLPLSGLYVDMLKRILALSAGTPAGELAQLTSLAPISVLDGFGHLHARAGRTAARSRPGISPRPKSPPTIRPDFTAPRAWRMRLNVLSAHDTLLPLSLSGSLNYGEVHTLALEPWLLALGAALLCLDALIALWLRGYLYNLRPARRGACRNFPDSAAAARPCRRRHQHGGGAGHEAGLCRHRPSRCRCHEQGGLDRAGRALKARTSYEPLDPMGVDMAETIFPSILCSIGRWIRARKIFRPRRCPRSPIICGWAAPSCSIPAT